MAKKSRAPEDRSETSPPYGLPRRPNIIIDAKDSYSAALIAEAFASHGLAVGLEGGSLHPPKKTQEFTLVSADGRYVFENIASHEVPELVQSWRRHGVELKIQKVKRIDEETLWLREQIRQLTEKKARRRKKS